MNTTNARQWSHYQEAIFTDVARGAGHTVVRARAGSGKTTTVMEALSHVPRGTSVMMCAFNKAIQEELKRRAPAHVRVQTLHAYGFAAIRRRYPNVEVYADKLDDVVHDLMPKARPFERGTVRKLASLSKSCLAKSLEAIDGVIDTYGLDVDDHRRQQVVEMARTAMIKSTENVDQIDFDDMVFMPLALDLKTDKFARLFIDEMQDLAPVQTELALRAVHEQARICGVGDDRQAIYQFRGAGQNVLGDLIARFSAKVLPLPISYRCSRAVVHYAQSLVPDFEAAPDAAEGTLNERVDVDQLLATVKDGDFVLSRFNAPLTQICIALIKQGRRATIAGRDIGQRVVGFIRRREVSSVSQLLSVTATWRDKEVKRLKQSARPAGHVEDLATIVEALSEGCRSIEEVIARAERLFSDEGGPRIECSSVHKAKGLERDRVWMLQDTFDLSTDAPIEESNIAYVAATRAKSELNLVVGIGGRRRTAEEA